MSSPREEAPRPAPARSPRSPRSPTPPPLPLDRTKRVSLPLRALQTLPLDSPAPPSDDPGDTRLRSNAFSLKSPRHLSMPEKQKGAQSQSQPRLSAASPFRLDLAQNPALGPPSLPAPLTPRTVSQLELAAEVLGPAVPPPPPTLSEYEAVRLIPASCSSGPWLSSHLRPPPSPLRGGSGGDTPPPPPPLPPPAHKLAFRPSPSRPMPSPPLPLRSPGALRSGPLAGGSSARGPVFEDDLEEEEGEDGEDEEASGPLGIYKTYSNVNWEDLESEIRDTPDTTEGQPRASRSQRRMEYFHAANATSSLESQRMLSFANDSFRGPAGAEGQGLGATQADHYERFFNELVLEHKRAVHKSPQTKTLKRDRSLNKIVTASSKPLRRRSSSTASSVKIQPLSEAHKKSAAHASAGEEGGPGRYKKKKIFKHLIKGTRSPTAQDSPSPPLSSSDVGLKPPPSTDYYGEEGDRALQAIRQQRPVHSLTELVEDIRAHSTLGRTLRNAHQDTLFWEDFEADDALTLEMEEGEGDDPNSNITYATFFKLVQRLTHPTISSDALLLSVFLLTYRSFVTPCELFELLLCRAYGVPPDPRPPNHEDKLASIRNRILVVLGIWLEKYYVGDFEGDERLLFLLAHFMHFVSLEPKSSVFSMLVYRGMGHQIHRHALGGGHGVPPVVSSSSSKRPKVPKPYLPKAGSDLKLLNLHPTELARQLALTEKVAFDQIMLGEYAHQGWSREDKMERSPHIVNMIERFNLICNWASSEVLRTSILKERAIVLHRLIIVAEESRALRNYNAVMAIISGLQSSPIYRLRDTWDLLPSKTWDLWDALNDLMSNENNFAKYRRALKEAESPVVPYIGIFLTDLVFINDGNLDYKPDTTLLNIKKLRFAASVLFSLDKCRGGEYRLAVVPSVQAYLSAPVCMTDDEQKQRSLALEGLR